MCGIVASLNINWIGDPLKYIAHRGPDSKSDFEIRSPCALDKLTMEGYASMMFDVYDFKSIGLRFFNVYDQNQDPSNPYSGVISIFIDRILKGKTITVNGGY